MTLKLGKAIEVQGAIYLVLNDLPPKTNKVRHIELVPFAKLQIRKGGEGVLEYLAVPPRMQYKKLGTKLLAVIFEYMESSNIRTVTFDNFAKIFWRKSVDRYPSQIVFPFVHTPLLGVLKLPEASTSTNL